MRELRAQALACFKRWIEDPKRALAFTDHLAAEWRRHPKATATYYYALEGPPRLLSLALSHEFEEGYPSRWTAQRWETGFIAIYVTHTRRKLRVTTRLYAKVPHGTTSAPSPLYDPVAA